jgi:D-alanyl-D-alanine dipeptidase
MSSRFYTRSVNAPLLSCCLIAAFAQAPSAPQSTPLDHSTQLIVVTTSAWNAINGHLQRFQRATPGSTWQPIGSPITVVVGKNGMAWGIGTAIRPPAPVDLLKVGPLKKEGDGKAPAGIFPLGPAFGYAARAPADWKMPYLPLTPTTDCVDDVHSRYYNRVLDRSAVTPDWKSAEHMRDAGEAYQWGLNIDYNTPNPHPQAGSCVFMHIWAGPGIPTVGCTAMPEQEIKIILAWLNPADHPLLVQMPEAQYRQMQKSLHLPPPPHPPA